MKRSLITSLMPATAIAIGATAIASQPSQATDYNPEAYLNYDDWAYSAELILLPDLDRAYQRDAPGYHYAYYSIARPEYLL